MLKDKLHTIVLCLRSGGDFNHRDVEVLSRNIWKHWQGANLRIICLNDQISQPFLLNNYMLYPTPQKQWEGWWTKMNLFSPEMEQFRPFLYIDLDTAIVNDVSIMFPTEENENKFIALGNFKIDKLTTELQSGLMWIPAKSITVTKIWDAWNSDSTRHQRVYKRGGDQLFLKNTIKAPEAYWQNSTNAITSFKINGSGGWLKEIPNHISIVCFHGFPRIWEASASIQWLKNYIK